MASPEAAPFAQPALVGFDPAAFNDNFFTAYKEQLADISVADQASAALADILKIDKSDGTQRSYQQIRDESRSFFASVWVRQDESLMNRMAMEFAAACMDHPHGAELAQDTSLSSTFAGGVESIYDQGHHGHGNHDHGKKADDGKEIGPKTGKKKTKKKFSWLDVLESIRKSAGLKAAKQQTRK